MDRRIERPKNPRLLAYAATVLALFVMFMVWQVNVYLFNSIKSTYYMVIVPVLVAGTLYFKGFKNGPEYALLLVYFGWFFCSRILNGDAALVNDFDTLFDLSLMLPLFLLGIALDRDGRKRFLDWLSAIVGGYYFLLGIICIVAFITRREYVNPITGGLLGIKSVESFDRINILDINVCATSFWFLMPLTLMIYEFFACRKKLWRVPIVLSALVDFSVIAITYTRSVKLSVSFCIALLAVLLVLEYVKIKKRAVQALLLAAVFAAAAPLTYKSFDLVANGLGHVSDAVLAAEAPESAAPVQTAEPAAAEAAAEEEPAEAYVDPRGWNGDLNSFSSGRMEIYGAAITTIQRNPSILLKGCLVKDSMTVLDEVLTRSQPHFHNFLIQVLILTGIPGLLAILALCLLLVVKAIRLFFSAAEPAEISAKVLVLPVAGSLLYSMFEANLFTATDIRPLFFYLMSGMLLGFYYDVFPRKPSK